MSKDERRAQLLATAWDIVREYGTDALTLGALAQRAGISKPIAYNHFQTRPGLMIALYEDINQRRLQTVAAALREVPANLADVAGALASAYMACHAALGPEWHAIGAALRGDAEMQRYQRTMIDGYVEFYHRFLAPVSPLRSDEVRRRCVGIVGAAEALSDAMVLGRVREEVAAGDLASLTVAWLSAPA
ncbi:TetR/AcrR family transcriptional regulator [Pseudoduganella lutea]|uniref:TetR/AcrR family transcriptional regulator n=2 Tax=Pseudoduganella lutea TaxID=321985 RepID=A0A4V0Z4I0_9BURK|nr:TetR/AcrR family transcriptional regulator [Pseudoduganella lutea]